MKPLHLLALLPLIYIFLLEHALNRLYSRAYDVVPEDKKKGCGRYISVRNPFTNHHCNNEKLRRLSSMCIKIYFGSVFFSLLAFVILAGVAGGMLPR